MALRTFLLSVTPLGQARSCAFCLVSRTLSTAVQTTFVSCRTNSPRLPTLRGKEWWWHALPPVMNSSATEMNFDSSSSSMRLLCAHDDLSHAGLIQITRCFRCIHGHPGMQCRCAAVVTFPFQTMTFASSNVRSAVPHFSATSRKDSYRCVMLPYMR